MEDFFNSLDIRTIDDDDKLLCENPITTAEIEDVIKNLKYNTAPCTDGLTSEFIESISNETLPSSMCQSLINLIPKPH